MNLNKPAGHVAVMEIYSKVRKSCGAVFQRVEKEGLLVIDGTRVRLSEEALFVSDAVFLGLI